MAVYLIGGAGYGGLELAFRGFTHWSMLLAGGLCFCLLYRISETPLKGYKKWLLGAASITAVEFLCGVVVNIWFGWNVWDYSHRPLNLCGQVCLLFTCLWFLLCIPAMAFCKVLQGWFRRVRLFPRERQGGSFPDGRRRAL